MPSCPTTIAWGQHDRLLLTSRQAPRAQRRLPARAARAVARLRARADVGRPRAGRARDPRCRRLNSRCCSSTSTACCRCSAPAWTGPAARPRWSRASTVRGEHALAGRRPSWRSTSPRSAAFRYRWPYPRWIHARAIRELLAAGARRVVYDVQFTEQSDDRAGDRALLRAAADPRVVLGTTERDADGAPAVLGGARALAAGGGRVGFATFPVDERRRLARPRSARRRGPPALSVLAAGGWHQPPPTHPIDFAGPPGRSSRSRSSTWSAAPRSGGGARQDRRGRRDRDLAAATSTPRRSGRDARRRRSTPTRSRPCSTATRCATRRLRRHPARARSPALFGAARDARRVADPRARQALGRRRCSARSRCSAARSSRSTPARSSLSLRRCSRSRSARSARSR